MTRSVSYRSSEAGLERAEARTLPSVAGVWEVEFVDEEAASRHAASFTRREARSSGPS